jgi:hypothetical protein
MVVAVLTVWVVQVSLHQVVNMVAMRDGVMAAARAVLMTFLVTLAAMLRRATARIRCVHFQLVLLDHALAGVVEMAVVQIIDMPAVSDGSVAAVRPVLMVVPLMVRCHVHHLLAENFALVPRLTPWRGPAR